jgi:transposase
MKPYSLDLQEKIVGAYEAGNTSIRKVAQLFQVSKSTVQALLNRKWETHSLTHRPATGGKPSQLGGHEAHITALVNDHPDYTLSEYCECWEEKTGVRLSESTMCRFLNQQNLTLKKHSGVVKPQQNVPKSNN